jgi:hypothetical protein
VILFRLENTRTAHVIQRLEAVLTAGERAGCGGRMAGGAPTE